MTAEKKTLDATMAAKQAMGYLNAMLPQAEGILLEEVEKLTEKTKDYWIITLSYNLNLSGIPSRGLMGMQYGLGKRDYKTFKIDSTTGEVISMKIRTV